MGQTKAQTWHKFGIRLDLCVGWDKAFSDAMYVSLGFGSELKRGLRLELGLRFRLEPSIRFRLELRLGLSLEARLELRLALVMPSLRVKCYESS